MKKVVSLQVGDRVEYAGKPATVVGKEGDTVTVDRDGTSFEVKRELLKLLLTVPDIEFPPDASIGDPEVRKEISDILNLPEIKIPDVGTARERKWSSVKAKLVEKFSKAFLNNLDVPVGEDDFSIVKASDHTPAEASLWDESERYELQYLNTPWQLRAFELQVGRTFVGCTKPGDKFYHEPRKCEGALDDSIVSSG